MMAADLVFDDGPLFTKVLITQLGSPPDILSVFSVFLLLLENLRQAPFGLEYFIGAF